MVTYTPIPYWLSIPIIELGEWIETAKKQNKDK
jgi:hypothetical protein